MFLGFPCGSAGKESACNARDLGSIPGLGRSTHWPGEFHGHSPWGHKESDTTEWLSLSPVFKLFSFSLILAMSAIWGHLAIRSPVRKNKWKWNMKIKACRDRSKGSCSGGAEKDLRASSRVREIYSMFYLQYNENETLGRWNVLSKFSPIYWMLPVQFSSCCIKQSFKDIWNYLF